MKLKSQKNRAVATMNMQEKVFARQMFQNKILKADGQEFENIFTAIMNYKESDFQSIKPWGNIGDKKNDGYIKDKDIFYQVYAPEDIRKSYANAVKKLKKDFSGLKSHWGNINEFYFVINDKYKGINADCAQAIQRIQEEYNLNKAEILTAKDLENILFKLDDDQILSVAGNIPDPALIKQIDYSVLSEVIGYIMKLPLKAGDKPNIVSPDWDKKIEFNNISEPTTRLLNNGSYQLESLNKYLNNNSDFLADSLRNKMNEIYLQERKKSVGDALFWAILNCASPKAEQMYQASVIVIMSKYFETCDIFESPKKE